ncbi:MAG: alpha/beta hydrolase [Acidimicrobiales bacterium]
MTAKIVPVPYDPELEAELPAVRSRLGSDRPLSVETIADSRRRFANLSPDLETVIAGRPVEYEDRVVPGPKRDPDIEVSIVRPAGGTSGAPGVYSIHGGGMVIGTRFFGIGGLVEMALEYGAVGVAVEYRLAPENPHPAPSEDCYAGLVWMAEHAEGLGVDPNKIIVSGGSAGGGLSAAVALMSRDRGGPRLAGQLLNCPMIDDRNETISSQQYDGIGLWDRNSNHVGWTALLGDARGGPGVSPYAAPARATDLSGLPPAYIEVGAAEVFRDEDVDYATGIWATGGQAELHVWSGCFHGFGAFVPEATVSKAAAAARRSWLRRVFGAE